MSKQASNKGKIAVIDGSNIAFEEASNGGKPKVSNIILVREELRKKGYDPIIVVDASLVHKIDDPKQLDALIDQKVVRQAPAGTDADYFVITLADENDALIVSNDRYSEYEGRFPWIKKRRMPLMIVRGAVEFYEHA
jgi:hypothetical protein